MKAARWLWDYVRNPFDTLGAGVMVAIGLSMIGFVMAAYGFAVAVEWMCRAVAWVTDRLGITTHPEKRTPRQR